MRYFISDYGFGWVFKPLPKSEEEIHEITRIMKPSQKFLKGQAKEEFFKQDAEEFEIIHLATHGILEEKQPLYSRIILAQDDDPAEDGFLQTFEIFNMDLKADLVVLSACETGLGELSMGEGLIGLTRAFLYAGVQSVIVSLWSVEESTSQLMKHFYQNLKDGMNKTEALRQAKIKLIHTREEGLSYAHPFLWAPFVLVGDWK
ncbi:MAG: CHAT domain-containing protein [Gemmatimonadota bacterium]|nr:MAG: CHAT domain-containing protein [Gemmatimonadota bacterium]